MSPTLLRVVRVFRIGRILRLIKAAKESSLNIRRVMSSDEGVYQCRADNAVGSVAASLSLIVHGETDKLIK